MEPVATAPTLAPAPDCRLAAAPALPALSALTGVGAGVELRFPALAAAAGANPTAASESGAGDCLEAGRLVTASMLIEGC